ncbi:MAG: nucleotidyltransferase domain-containing protein [Desulfobacterales bacterium]|nr:nucleotidyltransferase domain-containing protein [Desulfobacterales bacterium]
MFEFDSADSLKYSENICVIGRIQMSRSISRNEIIDIIRAERSFLQENFGVLSIGLFGSYAKNKQTPDSDIDFLVEFAEPRFEWVAGLNSYMEKNLAGKLK